MTWALPASDFGIEPLQLPYRDAAAAASNIVYRIVRTSYVNRPN
jgi:hypothetical protein